MVLPFFCRGCALRTNLLAGSVVVLPFVRVRVGLVGVGVENHVSF